MWIMAHVECGCPSLLFGVVLGLLTLLFLRPSPVPGCDLIYLFLTLSLAFSFQADAIKIYGQVVWGSAFWLVIGRRVMAISFRRLGLDSSSELKADDRDFINYC